MALPQGIRAGRAFVELFADDSKLVRGLRRAEKRLKAFGDRIRNLGLKIAGLGAAMLTPLIGAAKAFSSMGDQVAKMAKRTGLSVETLSELRFVASQTGTDFESLEMAFRKMQRSIYDAGRGLSTTVDALEDLGLTFQDLDGLSPEDQFKLLADRISQVEDPTRKAAIAMSLFGRTGMFLLSRGTSPPQFQQCGPLGQRLASTHKTNAWPLLPKSQPGEWSRPRCLAQPSRHPRWVVIRGTHSSPSIRLPPSAAGAATDPPATTAAASSCQLPKP